MRNHQELLSSIDPLDSVALDPGVLEQLGSRQGEVAVGQPLNLHVPAFKHFETSELPACGQHLWPAISVTGGDCALQCDHCKAKILEPMIAARTPDRLWQVAQDAARRGARGMLLSGGSNHANEVDYRPFLSVIRRLKDTFPHLTLAVHTGLVDGARARALEQAGVDVAMLDVIGSQETVTRVYHLKRPLSAFDDSVAALAATRMRVVPHIVIGLHYGRLLGEWRALETVSRHRHDALVLVVVMPFYASARRPFRTPDPSEVARFFLDARATLPDSALLLGCARPPGPVRMTLDSYAVLAGLNGIAHPSDGIVELARRLGRPVHVHRSCCSVSVLDQALALGGTDAVRGTAWRRG